MRLIDADALLEKLKGTPRYFDLKHDIEEQPTAYDVEKVLEQLEENAITDALAVAYLAQNKITFVSKRKALEIIEKGGVE